MYAWLKPLKTSALQISSGFKLKSHTVFEKLTFRRSNIVDNLFFHSNAPLDFNFFALLLLLFLVTSVAPPFHAAAKQTHYFIFCAKVGRWTWTWRYDGVRVTTLWDCMQAIAYSITGQTVYYHFLWSSLQNNKAALS